MLGAGEPHWASFPPAYGSKLKQLTSHALVQLRAFPILMKTVFFCRQGKTMSWLERERRERENNNRKRKKTNKGFQKHPVSFSPHSFKLDLNPTTRRLCVCAVVCVFRSLFFNWFSLCSVFQSLLCCCSRVSERKSKDFIFLLETMVKRIVFPGLIWVYVVFFLMFFVGRRLCCSGFVRKK